MRATVHYCLATLRALIAASPYPCVNYGGGCVHPRCAAMVRATAALQPLPSRAHRKAGDSDTCDDEPMDISDWSVPPKTYAMVVADLAACRAELASVRMVERAAAEREIDSQCAAFAAEHDRQYTVSQEAIDAATRRAESMEAALREINETVEIAEEHHKTGIDPTGYGDAMRWFDVRSVLTRALTPPPVEPVEQLRTGPRCTLVDDCLRVAGHPPPHEWTDVPRLRSC